MIDTITITVLSHEDLDDYFEGETVRSTIDDLSAILANIPEEYQGTAFITLNESSGDDYYNSYRSFNISYNRPMTSDEINEREASLIAAVAKRAAEIERREREMLAALMGKYGVQP